MTRESLFYRILSAIHIVFFTSILCFVTILLSGTLLLLPVMGAAFMIGKDTIYKVININDSIVKTFFRYLRSSLKLLKFVPVSLVMILNVVGMLVAAKAENMVYSVTCLAFIAFLLVLTMYIAGFYVFVNETVNLIDVMFAMFMKPLFLVPIFAGMVCCVTLFSNALLMILFFTGTFFMFAIEVVIFIQMLFYKKVLGMLDKNDEFAYLAYGKEKNR